MTIGAKDSCRHIIVLPPGITASVYLERESGSLVLELYDVETDMVARKFFDGGVLDRFSPRGSFMDSAEAGMDGMLRALECYRPGWDANGSPV